MVFRPNNLRRLFYHSCLSCNALKEARLDQQTPILGRHEADSDQQKVARGQHKPESGHAV